GAAIALLPLGLWYAKHGALGALVAALAPVGEATAYAARTQLAKGWWLDAWKVPLQQIKAFPLQVLLAVAAGTGGFWTRRTWSSFAPAAIFYAASAVACGMGGLRFYLHYLPQVLPGLVLIAVHPGGLAWWRGRARVLLVGATLFVAAGVVGRI